LDNYLQAALAAADASAAVIRRYYRGELKVELKSDQSPVTVADREAEELIRKILLDAFPEHGFFGEETGRSGAAGELLWIVDPIDGTKSFVAGYGMFSTQIALMQGSELILGVSSAPAHEETAWALQGRGAFLQGQPLRVKDCASIEAASISTGNIQTIAASHRWPAMGRIMARANRTRGYGDYYHYHRLAAGQLDAVIESDVNILDIAALAVIVREAGGLFTDLDGHPPSIGMSSVLAASPVLHSLLLEALHEDDA